MTTRWTEDAEEAALAVWRRRLSPAAQAALAPAGIAARMAWGWRPWAQPGPDGMVRLGGGGALWPGADAESETLGDATAALTSTAWTAAVARALMVYGPAAPAGPLMVPVTPHVPLRADLALFRAADASRLLDPAGADHLWWWLPASADGGGLDPALAALADARWLEPVGFDYFDARFDPLPDPRPGCRGFWVPATWAMAWADFPAADRPALEAGLAAVAAAVADRGGVLLGEPEAAALSVWRDVGPRCGLSWLEEAAPASALLDAATGPF